MTIIITVAYSINDDFTAAYRANDYIMVAYTENDCYGSLQRK